MTNLVSDPSSRDLAVDAPTLDARGAHDLTATDAQAWTVARRAGVEAIISVDDHVIEPPHLFLDQAPLSMRDRVPRIERDRAELSYRGGVFSFQRGTGVHDCDWWVYDGALIPTTRVSAAVSFDRDDLQMLPATFDEMRPGCYDPRARLDDMDVAGIGASISFPTLPRFCGQTFLEAPDKSLALWCVRAWNNWVLDAWCGADRSRLVGLCIVPLWDPELAAQEVRRCAAKGAVTVAFSENPTKLGLPSVHSMHWEPLWAACDETQTVVSMHIGSSSQMPSTSADAPALVSSAMVHLNAVGALCDWLLSGVLERHRTLRISLSEGQVGWMPYQLERLDKVWEANRAWGDVAISQPPSSYVPGRVYGCVFDDDAGLMMRDSIGMSQIMFECDYPHSDSSWPNCATLAGELVRRHGLTRDETYALLRGNAIECFGLSRNGVWR